MLVSTALKCRYNIFCKNLAANVSDVESMMYIFLVQDSIDEERKEKPKDKRIGGRIVYDDSVPKYIPPDSCLFLEYFAKHNGRNTTLAKIIHNPSKEHDEKYFFAVPNIEAEYEAIRINLNIGWCSKDGSTHEGDFTSGSFYRNKVEPTRNLRRFGPTVNIAPGLYILLFAFCIFSVYTLYFFCV